MEIKNPNKLPTIDYRLLKPLQADLKDLTEKNYAKLKSVLEKRGFEIPVFVWNDGKEKYLMDGHQRQRVMTREDMNDNGSYEVPYIEIKAENKKEAMAKLLEISSQYGTITQEGFDAFIAGAELPEAELISAVNFDALPLLGSDLTTQDDLEGNNEASKKYIAKITFDSQEELNSFLEEIKPVIDSYSAVVSVNDD